MIVGVLLSVLLATHGVFGLGSKCSAPITGGTKAPSAPFWLNSISKRGSSAFNVDRSYSVRRSVKDFGAIGDGKADDTASINAALSSEGRCAAGCDSSTLTPLVLYFPSGTYKISSPINVLYYTAMIGNPGNPPTIIASTNFTGAALIDGNPNNYYVNQNNFYRSIRNFVLDMRQLPIALVMNGIHWQVSQATSIYNVRIEMSRDSSTGHVGLWMENGSGGFFGDLTLNGGAMGLNMGNQQFTVRNVVINGAQVGIYLNWSWVWLFYQITITNCKVGFRLNTGSTQAAQATGATVITDTTVTNTGTFLQTTTNQPGSLKSAYVVDNVVLKNVTIGVSDMKGNVALSGGSKTISQFIQGTIYSGGNSTGKYTRASASGVIRPSVLLENGLFISRPRPQYANYDVSQFVSVKALGAVGDGVTDDTAALKSIFAQYSGCKVIFFDAGTYIISSTVTIPAGTQMIGEAWSTIMGSGPFFSNISNPQVVVRIGDVGSSGVTEISDMVFSTRASTKGAIVIEWNVRDPADKKGVAGMWDTIIRIGGAEGTDLLAGDCPTTNYGTSCVSAFLGLHLTKQSTAYIEGLWMWTADHDMEKGPQTNVYSGRGILSESQGPVWLVGTGSEHNVLYQYNLVGAQNHFLGVIQTESPYYQPRPASPTPFSPVSAYNDPISFGSPGNSWALRIKNSSNVLVYGAGLYSFFDSYDQTCVNPASCQNQIVDVDSTSSKITILGLSTVGVSNMLSINSQATIPQAPNRCGLQSSVMKWTLS